MDEAESFIKNLTDDFSATVSQLADWESRLNETVNQAAFKETWEKDLLSEGKSDDLAAAHEVSLGRTAVLRPWDWFGIVEGSLPGLEKEVSASRNVELSISLRHVGTL